MKHKAKRIVSAICALALCAAMLPAQAFAAPEVTSTTDSSVVTSADGGAADTRSVTQNNGTSKGATGTDGDGNIVPDTAGKNSVVPDTNTGSTGGTTPETTTGDAIEGAAPATVELSEQQSQPRLLAAPKADDYKDGWEITINVYVDGENAFEYATENEISVENGIITFNGSTHNIPHEFVFDSVTQNVKCDFIYDDNNCADIKWQPATGYTVQAIDGTLVYGSGGSNGYTATSADNVRGGSALNIYLVKTSYAINYKVDDVTQEDLTVTGLVRDYAPEVPTGTGTTGEGSCVTPFEGWNSDRGIESDHSGMQPGYQVTWKPEVNDSFVLAEVPQGVTGWFKDSDYSNRVTDTSLNLENVLDDSNGFAVANGVITLYGTRQQVQLAKEITKVNGKKYWSGDRVQAGDVVTYTVTVTNIGQSKISSVTVEDTFGGAGTPDVVMVNGTRAATFANGKASWTVENLDVNERKSIRTPIPFCKAMKARKSAIPPLPKSAKMAQVILVRLRLK